MHGPASRFRTASRTLSLAFLASALVIRLACPVEAGDKVSPMDSRRREQDRRHLENRDCDYIRDTDLRHFCQRRCEYIRDKDLRRLCEAERQRQETSP